MNQIEIYETGITGGTILVQVSDESVWLNQEQMSELFKTDRSVIGKHVANIYASGELNEKATCAKFAQVQKEGERTINRQILHYNLDVIISIGYRVNSQKATQFRIWATQRLKEYLVQGYAINQERLTQLQKVVEVIQKSGSGDNLHLSEASGLLEILGNYTRSFILLNQFDSNRLQNEGLNENITYEIKYREAKAAIAEMRRQLKQKGEATDLFGNEKDNSFEGTLQNVVQTFDGQYLYPSIEEQAAHLLYFIIKNHPFSDGNKRIGAFIFVWFLEKNKHLFKKQGERKINDNGLTALALLVAQSDPSDKDLMVKLITNLINDK